MLAVTGPLPFFQRVIPDLVETEAVVFIHTIIFLDIWGFGTIVHEKLLGLGDGTTCIGNNNWSH